MYYITVSNGLLTKEHKKKMGSAVWEFMWCLDKMTMVDKDGRGVVLGGKPVQLNEIGIGHNNTTSINIHKLEKHGYLKTKRTPFGMIIYINKPKKQFQKRNEYPLENSVSLKPVYHKNSVSPLENSVSPTRNSGYKEDNTVDNTVDSIAPKGASPLSKKKGGKTPKDPQEKISCEQFVESCRKSPNAHIRVIAEWAEAENPKNTTRAEWEQFIRRNLRAAKELSVYEIPRIEKAYQLMLKDVVKIVKGKKVGFITKYGLETVGKYIDLV